jgi:hypothetical protein
MHLDRTTSSETDVLFQIILALGNYMNGGQRGGAFGFKIGSLLKVLNPLRKTKNKFSTSLSVIDGRYKIWFG